MSRSEATPVRIRGTKGECRAAATCTGASTNSSAVRMAGL